MACLRKLLIPRNQYLYMEKEGNDRPQNMKEESQIGYRHRQKQKQANQQ